MRWKAPEKIINYDRFKCYKCKRIWKEPIYENSATEGTIRTMCTTCISIEEALIEQGKQE